MNKTIFWTVSAALCITLLILISNNLAPFFIAFIFAYILTPLINNIAAKYKLPRTLIAYGVFILFFGSFILALAILTPLLYQQIFTLILKIPLYKQYLQTELVPLLAEKFHSIDPTIASKIETSMQSFINGAFSLIAGLFGSIWGYTIATINIFTIILFVPIILIYLLKDWPKILKTMKELLPIKDKSNICEVVFSINNLLSAYIRGQLNICLLLSIFYSVGLSIIGLDFAALIGILSGFLIIIPLIGTLISFLLALIIGYFSFHFTPPLAYIALLYIGSGLIEGYILTPKIIGDRIGLHPLWIMFAVFACGSLFGFVGIFFAIPIAGIIKVLVAYGIEFYKSSKIYKS